MDNFLFVRNRTVTLLPYLHASASLRFFAHASYVAPSAPAMIPVGPATWLGSTAAGSCMPNPPSKTARHFTDAAREAALAARRAKRAEPDTFGLPEVFVVKAGDQSYAWELRRFGGVLLERGIEAFASPALARADGESALATLCASPDLPTFKRELRP